MDPSTPATSIRSGQVAVLRIVVCVAAVFAITALLYTVPLSHRAIASALVFFFVILIFGDCDSACKFKATKAEGPE